MDFVNSKPRVEKYIHNMGSEEYEGKGERRSVVQLHKCLEWIKEITRSITSTILNLEKPRMISEKTIKGLVFDHMGPNSIVFGDTKAPVFPTKLHADCPGPETCELDILFENSVNNHYQGLSDKTLNSMQKFNQNHIFPEIYMNDYGYENNKKAFSDSYIQYPTTNNGGSMEADIDHRNNDIEPKGFNEIEASFRYLESKAIRNSQSWLLIQYIFPNIFLEYANIVLGHDVTSGLLSPKDIYSRYLSNRYSTTCKNEQSKNQILDPQSIQKLVEHAELSLERFYYNVSISLNDCIVQEY
ncbi:hypothetical protein BB559_002486 [Furculomyces boomerangus]|uniref:Uncharacterized protein n=2 Tax=Harpellales TaxID=61421 RepID=A0A2T9YV06_9FUNG|nr:hypothetical protein BB559_002486 [Furculomyces boomerangus]PWA00236.1 hypothetical protein BB558_003733 [Smittium angustum]